MAKTLIDTRPQPRSHRLPIEEAGCGGSCSTPPRGAAKLNEAMQPISVDGIIITEEEIAQELQNHDAEDLSEARAIAARALLIRRLLLNRAHVLNLTPEPETDELGRWETAEEALIRRVLELEAVPMSPADEEIRRVYLSDPTRWPDQFEKAEPVIRARLSARAWMVASASYVASLAKTARIVGISLEPDQG